ncbi:hypothetical protein [Vulcanisaeta distributa]|uniref:hypothetical protein n=1 Tax=Vulcanisaeta distributa TaxID=164451 RepID=UPI001FB44DEC|nr:hypothetical protein [Vulcanisaeta distributa]
MGKKEVKVLAKYMGLIMLFQALSMVAAALLIGNALSVYFVTNNVPAAASGGVSAGLAAFFGAVLAYADDNPITWAVIVGTAMASGPIGWGIIIAIAVTT